MALTQVKSDGIATGAVTATQIAVNAVTVDDISDGSISTAKLADDSVNGDKLANTAVTAGTYGSSSAIPSITVDAQGRITSASTSSIDSTAITNGTSNVSVAASGDITASRAGTTRLTVNSTGAAVVGDLEVDGTGYVGLPAGTTAERPASASAGYFRYNTTNGSTEFYNGSTWVSTNLIPSINSATGTIYAGAATNLTLGVTNVTDNIDVVFREGATTLATVTGQTVSSGSVTVAVPSAVYGQTAGDTIAISVVNADGTPSSNSQNLTVTALPTGGTITSSGGYRYHTFTTTNDFENTIANLSVEYIVVAGGGSGGGGTLGGGGGAGGMLAGSTTLSATTYTCTVGSGGTATTTPGSETYGTDSSFGSIAVATKGGCGHSNSGVDRRNGGSGGGGHSGWSPAATGGGSGTTGQGNDGGDGNQNQGNWANSGGGGGKGAAGAHAGSSYAGNGGAGINTYSAWATATSTGDGGYYAGGGGGTSYNTSNHGTGGAGGGADGGGSGSAGQANTGGGGSAATNGGSGIIIIRYQV